MEPRPTITSRNFVRALVGVSDALTAFDDGTELPTGGRVYPLSVGGMLSFHLTASSPSELREFGLRLIDSADKWADSLPEQP